MRVAITVDPYLPVPPLLYGGIERVVDVLVRGLLDRGHDVTLLAHPASSTGARLIPYGAPPHTGWRPRLAELWQVGRTLWRRRHECDLVHSFGRLAALAPILPVRRLPKIQSYQRHIPWGGVRKAVVLSRGSLRLTACSTSLYRGEVDRGPRDGRWQTIFNGVDLGTYPFVPAVPAGAPLVFLGRIEAIKGPHHAIAIARKAGRPLVIAGNVAPAGESAEYFAREIRPHVDGRQVTYVGPVDDVQKSRLLGGAAALLMPIEWEEPFGIVMAEALACGTPVIGFARGSVPEVVRDGVNGYLCRTVDEAAAAAGRLDAIGRAAVRADCEARFGDAVIVDAYERLYREALAG
jgi:glycosyltransferase involved in cell wall biosynthesis